MKGQATEFLLLFIGALIVIAIIAAFLSTVQGEDISSGPGVNRPLTYDPVEGTYDLFTIDSGIGDIYDLADKAENQNFCEILKECVKRVTLYGGKCEVGEFSYGSNLYDSIKGKYGIPEFGGCSNEELNVTIDDGVEEKICDYNEIDDNTWEKRSDVVGLSFDNCIMSDGKLMYDGTDEGIVNEEFLDDPEEINVYFSPDYFYTEDYLHPPDNVYYSFQRSKFFNGAGKMKIVVSGTEREYDRTDCKFNLLICPQPSFAITESEKTIEIFNIFRTLKIGKRSDIPYYIQDRSAYAKKIKLDGKDLNPNIYYTEYEVELDRPYYAVTIINAIKSGFYYNEEITGRDISSDSYYTWSHPHWNIHGYYDLTFDDPWDQVFDVLLESDDKKEKTREIVYNCGEGSERDICEGKLKIKVGLRGDRKEIDDKKDLTYVSMIVAFAEENPDISGSMIKGVISSKGNIEVNTKTRIELWDSSDEVSILADRVCFFEVDGSESEGIFTISDINEYDILKPDQDDVFGGKGIIVPC